MHMRTHIAVPIMTMVSKISQGRRKFLFFFTAPQTTMAANIPPIIVPIRAPTKMKLLYAKIETANK